MAEQDEKKSASAVAEAHKKKIKENLTFTAGLNLNIVTKRELPGHSANNWLQSNLNQDTTPEDFKKFMESSYADFPDKNGAKKIDITNAQVSTTSTEPQVIKVAARQAAYRFGSCVKISGGSSTQQYLAAAELYALGVTVEWGKTPSKGTNAYRIYELCEKRSTFFANQPKESDDAAKRLAFYKHLNTPENQALQSFNIRHTSPAHLDQLMKDLMDEENPSPDIKANKCFELLQHIASTQVKGGWHYIASFFNLESSSNERHDRLRQVIAIAKKDYRNDDGSFKEGFQQFKEELNRLVKENGNNKLSIDETNELRDALRDEKIEDIKSAGQVNLQASL